MPTFVQILDFIGTFAFAISGIRLASAKRFDWFGAYVVGFVTAIGGGTPRSIGQDQQILLVLSEAKPIKNILVPFLERIEGNLSMFMISKGHDLCPIMKTSKDSTDGPHIPFDKFYGKRGLQLAFCRKGIMLGKELSRFPLREKARRQ